MNYNPTTKEVTYSAKTFVIDHPKNPERYLVHGCLEGPEAGVYYRGIGEIESESVVVDLPHYTDSLAFEFTVNLTPIGKPRPLGASRVKNGQFEVYGTQGEFYWTVFGKRLNINTEPVKSEVVVHGHGPYRWI